jgi:hypothetical protein
MSIWHWRRGQRAVDDRCGRCGWHLPAEGHAPGCPTRFDTLQTSADINEARLALAMWAEAQERVFMPGVPVMRQVFATALTARAVEIGEETW